MTRGLHLGSHAAARRRRPPCPVDGKAEEALRYDPRLLIPRAKAPGLHLPVVGTDSAHLESLIRQFRAPGPHLPVLGSRMCTYLI